MNWNTGATSTTTNYNDNNKQNNKITQFSKFDNNLIIYWRRGLRKIKIKNGNE